MNIEKRLEAIEGRLREAEDQLEIIRLLSTYGPAVDSGSSQEAAALWIDEGVYDVGGRHRAVGHSAIAALYDAQEHQNLIHQGSSHLTSTPQITLNGDHAMAVAYSYVVLRNDEGWGFWRASVNTWTLKRTAQGWRIVERLNRTLDGSSETHELLRSAVA